MKQIKPTVPNDINVVDYLWVARMVARKYTKERPIADTVEYSDACIGLLKAKRLYDPATGYKFSTLAFRAAWTTVQDGKRRKGKYQDKAWGLLGIDERAIGMAGLNLKKNAFSPDFLEKIDPIDKSSQEPSDTEVDEAVAVAKRILGHDDFQVLLRLCYSKSYREIGQEFHISKARVWQIVSRINSKLEVARNQSFPVKSGNGYQIHL